jgi:hypothetical protein
MANDVPAAAGAARAKGNFVGMDRRWAIVEQGGSM